MQVNKGVLQGGSLSPFLFIYYINDLIKILIAETKETDRVHFFADDVMVISSSKDEATRLIKIIEGWLTSRKLSLNKNKSAIMIIQ